MLRLRAKQDTSSTKMSGSYDDSEFAESLDDPLIIRGLCTGRGRQRLPHLCFLIVFLCLTFVSLRLIFMPNI